MNDITILHLSDLHIESSDGSYSNLLKHLLDDIESTTKYVKEGSLVVVVTGDILHQANSRALQSASKFFKDLNIKIGRKVKKIYIVPGNHDKCRTTDDKFLIPAYRALREHKNKESHEFRTKSIFDDGFRNSFWSFHHKAYDSDTGSGYIGLTKEIYKEFGMKDDEIEEAKYINNTYGVCSVEIFGKRFCFILLNTSWSCVDDFDNRNLIIGKFQLDEIREQYRREINAEPERDFALTIALGHHPMNSLKGEEEDMLFSSMVSFEGLKTDVYLCGHTHDRDIVNWSNNTHSVTTLVTGIGWPEKEDSSHVGQHTYSIYVFNIDENSTDIYVRGTDDRGVFNPDFRIYASNIDKNIEKISKPIHPNDCYPYIVLSSSSITSQASYYITKEFMSKIQQYHSKIGKFQYIVGALTESDKNELYENISIGDKENIGEFDDGSEDTDDFNRYDQALFSYLYQTIDIDIADIPDDVTELLNISKNRNLTNEMLLGFLTKICQILKMLLTDDNCREGDVARFHFRFLSNFNTYTYRRLCTSFNTKEEMGENDISEMDYGDLLKLSYDTGNGCIYTINEATCARKLSAKWMNFITVVPTFDRNNYNRKTFSRTEKHPFITFGLTTNTNSLYWLLYCMDYFSIKNVLDELIDRYIQIFGIDLKRFCEWAKNNIREKGAIIHE